MPIPTKFLLTPILSFIAFVAVPQSGRYDICVTHEVQAEIRVVKHAAYFRIIEYSQNRESKSVEFGSVWFTFFHISKCILLQIYSFSLIF